MKAVLLAGGLGTRMREETEFRPKPMVDIGGEPILMHIMRNLADAGIADFVVATGYKRDVITDYFAQDSEWRETARPSEDVVFFEGHDSKSGWNVTLAYTGEVTGTGGRVFRVADLLDGQRFFVTYGDGLADVDIRSLMAFHNDHARIATVTAVQPTSRFGLMEIDSRGQVLHFREKPKMKDWVSIGFFIFEPEIMSYLSDDCGLEEDGLTNLVAKNELSAFQHEGFWQPMDTYREYQILQELWNSGSPPWRRPSS